MTTDSYDAMRNAMVVSQLRPEGVTDAGVIEAMRHVPREDFVPESRRSTAYADVAIPLGDGRAINPPVVIARLLDAAQISSGDRVLIVGSASPYTAAVAARLTGAVTSIEAGAEPRDDFDVIMIDGAVEHVPELLVDALAPGGRMVTGLVEAGVTRLAVGRRSSGGFALVSFADADMVALPQYASPKAFVF